MQKLIRTIFLIALMCFSALSSEACSLALHKWERVFYIKIPVSAPVFPLSELGAALGKIPENSAKRVRWIADHHLISELSPAFLPLIKGWLNMLPWELVRPGNSVMTQARKADQIDFPLIIGTDKCFLKIALFSDSNSSGNCKQLVIMQTSRIRAVFPDRKSPWAQEINGQSWLSLIFFQVPVPGRIMSFSAYPVAGLRQSIYEDHGLVENLLTEKKLTRRPDLEIDPYQFDFPELPE